MIEKLFESDDSEKENDISAMLYTSYLTNSKKK
jgi:hypothetical protein